MARIVKQPNGGRYIQFTGMDNKKKSLRLGKVAQSVAEQVKIRVERILACRLLAIPLDHDLETWVRSLSDEMAKRFAAVGLIPERIDSRLKPFLDKFIADRNDTKKSSRDNMAVMVNRLIDFFKPDRPLHTVTHADALDFAAMLKKRYASTTAGRTLRRCRQAFAHAVQRDLIAKNPFDGINIAMNPDPARKHFISRTVAAHVLEACPDARWRLIFALCRFAGLRCPSEHLALTWGDIDWARSRIRINSPKTGERWCPLFPELRPHLQAAYDLAPEGTVHIIDRKTTNKTNLRTQFSRIVRKAGHKPWPKIFHNLRASCETELAEKYPIHVVCSWLGNSSAIANKHYLQVLDTHFKDAGSGDAKSDAKSASLAMQSGSDEIGAKQSDGSENTKKSLRLQGLDQDYSVTVETVQIVNNSPGSSGTSEDSSGETMKPS